MGRGLQDAGQSSRNPVGLEPYALFPFGTLAGSGDLWGYERPKGRMHHERRGEAVGPTPEPQCYLGRGQPRLNGMLPGSRRGRLGGAEFLVKARRTPAHQPQDPHKVLSNHDQEVYLRVGPYIVSGL